MNNWCEFNAPDRKIIIKSFLNYSTNRATGYCGCGRRLPTQKKNGIGGQESREYRFQTYVGQLNCMIHHVRWNCFFLGGHAPRDWNEGQKQNVGRKSDLLAAIRDSSPKFPEAAWVFVRRRESVFIVVVVRFLCELIVIFPMENHGWIISWNKKIGEEFCDCNCLSLL